MSLEEDELIERFLKGELSEEEVVDFQDRMLSDQTLAEKVAFEKQLFEVLNEADWSHVRNEDHPEIKAYTALFQAEETRQLKENILAARQSYHAEAKKPQKKNRMLWSYLAAAVVIFAAAALFTFSGKQSSEDLYNRYLAATELPSMTSRGATPDVDMLARAQQQFEQQNYMEVVRVLGSLNESEEFPAGYYIYLALSQVETGNLDESINTINLLINSSLLDSAKGYWYKSLIYLNADMPEKAKTELELIVTWQYYNYELARELLDSL